MYAGAEGAEVLNAVGTISSGGGGMEAMGMTERRTLLSTNCGVISVICDRIANNIFFGAHSSFLVT